MKPLQFIFKCWHCIPFARHITENIIQFMHPNAKSRLSMLFKDFVVFNCIVTLIACFEDFVGSSNLLYEFLTAALTTSSHFCVPHCQVAKKSMKPIDQD